MRELVRISKALSDETRARMLKLLLEKDVCVCEMQMVFNLSQSQISRNLKVLTDAGLLKRWREGKSVVYVANRDTNNIFCQAILDALADSFNEDNRVSEDRQKLEQATKSGLRQKIK